MRQNPPDLTSTLWHCTAHGHQVIQPNKPYIFHNKNRSPKDDVVLQISLRGSVTFTHKKQQTIIPANHLFIHIFGEDVSYTKTHPSQLYENMWLNIRGAGLLDHINLFRSRFNMMIDISSNNTFIDQMNHLRRLCAPTSTAPTTTISSHIHQYIMSLFDFAEQHRATQQTPAQRAIDMIIAKPSYPWSIPQVADEVGCSREHFSRLFTETIGQPPLTYLNAIRTNRAIQLIKGTSLPLKDIAKQLGFPSTHTFARQVKARTKLSPQHLRDKHLK